MGEAVFCGLSPYFLWKLGSNERSMDYLDCTSQLLFKCAFSPIDEGFRRLGEYARLHIVDYSLLAVLLKSGANPNRLWNENTTYDIRHGSEFLSLFTATFGVSITVIGGPLEVLPLSVKLRLAAVVKAVITPLRYFTKRRFLN